METLADKHQSNDVIQLMAAAEHVDVLYVQGDILISHSFQAMQYMFNRFEVSATLDGKYR